MEQNITMLSKKVWNIVRVAIYMIRKGLCKKKIFMDLNMIMKRGKIVGKALKNLIFHHHHHQNHLVLASRGIVGGASNFPYDGREYEFSCSNTPLYHHFFNNRKKSHVQNNAQYYIPSPMPLEEADNVTIEEVNKMLEMMLSNEHVITTSGLAASPTLPGLGFGQSPMVRQLQITDSPFSTQYTNDNKYVDQEAEDFIKNFYFQLKQQN
ncbi:uncharacterized protein LOC130799703 [Amaranthus tricolor]|uniref:uncharacterized protein LOC130799703 n=1 Tax=Amaranthus tricolor TaxID=29722 RepID=UPI0025869105|nr:uncharacterized protein LOC130799703 [Amaranthus tricolor]